MCFLKQWNSVNVVVAPSFIFDRFLEIHAVFRYDYQRLLVLAKSTNLLALRWYVKLFHRSVTQMVPIKNPLEESRQKHAQLGIRSVG